MLSGTGRAAPLTVRPMAMGAGRLLMASLLGLALSNAAVAADPVSISAATAAPEVPPTAENAGVGSTNAVSDVVDVETGDVLSSAGAKTADSKTKKKVKPKKIPSPPLDAGSAEASPAEVVEQSRRQNPVSLTLTEDLGEVDGPTLVPDQQPSLGQQSVSLGDVLTEVWRTNPQAKEAELAVQAAGFDISASRTGYYPYIAVQNEQSEAGGTGIVRVVQPLWSGGITWAQVDAAKAQLKGALADLNRTRLQLGLNTVEAYLNVMSATEQSRQWRNYADELKQLLKVIQRRASEGVAPQADVQTARTRLSQAEAGYQASISQMESNRAQLIALLNYEPGNVSWPDDNRRLSDDEAASAGGANIKAHPESQFAQAEVERLEATARAAKASLWPQLNAEYRRALRDYTTDSGNNDTVLLSMQYQTDSGLRAYRQYGADKQRVESAKAALTAADRGVAASIRVARTERRAAEAQFAVQVQAAESARALVDSFLRQFEVGRKTWLEVLTAQRDANEAVLSAIAVRRNFWSANSRLALQGLMWRRLSDGAPDINAIIEQ